MKFFGLELYYIPILIQCPAIKSLATNLTNKSEQSFRSKFPHIGKLKAPLDECTNWSEQSAFAAIGCWHKRRWQLFLIFFHSCCCFLVVIALTAVVKIPEGVVKGIKNFAWPPN
jgi:hypothetical protein